MKKHYLLLLLSCLETGMVSAQFSLQDCRSMAKENYPLVKQYKLLEQSKSYNVDNLNRLYLPQLSFVSQASLQSDVTKLGVSLPGVNIESQKKDQYLLKIEADQVIWDGGVIGTRKKMVEAEDAIEKNQLDVDMYSINQRVDQLFFGIVLVDEQLKDNQLYINDLQRNLEVFENSLKLGIVRSSDVDKIKVALLERRQQTITLNAAKESYQKMLASFIGLKGTQQIKLQSPVDFERLSVSGSDGLDKVIRRHELDLYDAYGRQAEEKNKLLTAESLPKFSAFAEGAYGRPIYNTLNPNFDTGWKFGVRLTYNISNLYTLKKKRELIKVDLSRIQSQRETFLLNTNLELLNNEQALVEARGQLKQDDEIVKLRENIVDASSSELKNGTIRTTDYLDDLSKLHQARIARVVHQIKLYQSIEAKKRIAGYDI
ncbi:MAG: TolC family protein [Bacteroidaceae bacterium]